MERMNDMSAPMPSQSTTGEEEREDYLDYCAAAEALDQALQDSELTPIEDFIDELGLREDLDL